MARETEIDLRFKSILTEARADYLAFLQEVESRPVRLNFAGSKPQDPGNVATFGNPKGGMVVTPEVARRLDERVQAVNTGPSMNPAAARLDQLSLVRASATPIDRDLIRTQNEAAAQAANRAISRVRAAGFNVMPSVIADSPDLPIFRSGKGVAAYISELNAIGINPAAELWNDPQKHMQQLREAGKFSTADPDHPIFHELGHAALKQNIGAEKYAAMRGRQLTPTQQQFISKHVSSYAAQDPIEMVAEVFSGLVTGREFPKGVMDIYRMHGGPAPAPRTIEFSQGRLGQTMPVPLGMFDINGQRYSRAATTGGIQINPATGGTIRPSDVAGFHAIETAAGRAADNIAKSVETAGKKAADTIADIPLPKPPVTPAPPRDEIPPTPTANKFSGVSVEQFMAAENREWERRGGPKTVQLSPEELLRRAHEESQAAERANRQIPRQPPLPGRYQLPSQNFDSEWMRQAFRKLDSGSATTRQLEELVERGIMPPHPGTTFTPEPSAPPEPSIQPEMPAPPPRPQEPRATSRRRQLTPFQMLREPGALARNYPVLGGGFAALAVADVGARLSNLATENSISMINAGGDQRAQVEATLANRQRDIEGAVPIPIIGPMLGRIGGFMQDPFGAKQVDIARILKESENVDLNTLSMRRYGQFRTEVGRAFNLSNIQKTGGDFQAKLEEARQNRERAIEGLNEQTKQRIEAVTKTYRDTAAAIDNNYVSYNRSEGEKETIAKKIDAAYQVSAKSIASINAQHKIALQQIQATSSNEIEQINIQQRKALSPYGTAAITSGLAAFQLYDQAEIFQTEQNNRDTERDERDPATRAAMAMANRAAEYRERTELARARGSRMRGYAVDWASQNFLARNDPYQAEILQAQRQTREMVEQAPLLEKPFAWMAGKANEGRITTQYERQNRQAAFQIGMSTLALRQQREGFGYFSALTQIEAQRQQALEGISGPGADQRRQRINLAFNEQRESARLNERQRVIGIGGSIRSNAMRLNNRPLDAELEDIRTEFAQRREGVRNPLERAALWIQEQQQLGLARRQNANQLRLTDLSQSYTSQSLSALLARDPMGAQAANIVGQTMIEGTRFTQQGMLKQAEAARGIGLQQLALERQNYTDAFRGTEVSYQDLLTQQPRDVTNPTEVLDEIARREQELKTADFGDKPPPSPPELPVILDLLRKLGQNLDTWING